MKLAVVKLSAMGDIIHAMVALQFIKKQRPDIKIDWIVEESFKGVLDNNPDIDNILTLNLKSIKKRKLNIFAELKKIKEYSKNNYDAVIDVQGLIKSAVVSKMLGGRVVGSFVAGFDKNSIREKAASWFYDKTVSIAYDKNTIDRNVKVLCEPLGIKVTSEDIINKEKFLYYKPSHTIHNVSPYILFVIGSTWESRNYPKEKFAKIADALQITSYIAWGSEEEGKKADWIEENSQYAKKLPKMNLNDLKEIIANSKLLIGNDTGPTHMAWGLNIPSITIFGPTPINRVYQTPINFVVESNSIVDHYRLDKEDYSIREIDEEEIIQMAKGLINC